VYAFNSNGELLLVNDAKGKWNMPGGGRDNGEKCSTKNDQRNHGRSLC
jgi:8-oxo-dGTP pyrophosphatase MutT (NUDIX family)